MESKSTHLLTGDVKRSSGRVKSSGGRRLNTVGQPPGLLVKWAGFWSDQPSNVWINLVKLLPGKNLKQVQSILELVELEVMDQALINTQNSNQSAVISRKDRIDYLYPNSA